MNDPLMKRLAIGQYVQAVGAQLVLAGAAFFAYLVWWVTHQHLLDLPQDWKSRIGFAAVCTACLLLGAIRALVSPALLIPLAAGWIILLPDGAWAGLLILVWLAPKKADSLHWIIGGTLLAFGSAFVLDSAFYDLSRISGVPRSDGILLGATGSLWGVSVFSSLPIGIVAVAAGVAYVFRDTNGIGIIALLVMLTGCAWAFIRNRRSGGNENDDDDDQSARFARSDEIGKWKL